MKRSVCLLLVLMSGLLACAVLLAGTPEPISGPVSGAMSVGGSGEQSSPLPPERLVTQPLPEPEPPPARLPAPCAPAAGIPRPRSVESIDVPGQRFNVLDRLVERRLEMVVPVRNRTKCHR